MDNKHRPNYLAVWAWLVGLVTASAMASFFLPKSTAVFLIFFLATIKALLVALNYMHLKYEKLLIYSLAIVPLLIVIILAITLFPDFVFRN